MSRKRRLGVTMGQMMQTESKHTPGPWTQHGLSYNTGPAGLGDHTAILTVKRPGTSLYVASIKQSSARDGHEADANVRLIAEAPAMLEALRDAARSLEEFCRDQHPDNVCCHTLRNVQAIIARIDGGR